MVDAPSHRGGPIDGDGPAAPGWGAGVKRGIAWSALTFGMSKALSLLSLLVLARLLVPAEFGVVAAVVAYMAIIEVVSDLGMKASVVYEQERGVTSRVQTAWTANAAAAALLAAVGVLAAPWLAGLFGVPDETDLFRIGALNIALAGLGNVHDALLLRDLALNRRFVPQLVRDLLRVGVSVGLAFAGLGAASMVWGYLVGTVGWVTTLWLLSPLRPDVSFDRRAARSMAGYGAAAASHQLLAALTTRADVIVIGAVLGTAQLGIYTIAYRLPEVLLASVAYTLTVVAFPALAMQRSQAEAGLAAATLALLRYQTLYAAALGTGLAVLSGPLVTVLFGARWAPAGPVMVALSVSFAVQASVFPLGDLLKAVDKQRILVAITLVELPLLFAGMVLAAQSSAEAVAWTLAGFTVAFAATVTRYVARELGVGARELLGAMAPGLATGLGVAVGTLGAMAVAGDGILAILIGTLAGASSGALALRLAAPAFARDVARQVRDVLRARRRDPGAVAAG
ncbi:MAG: oligosaccharide flippase family protein [Solirubrobacteraceae bacterium]